MIKKKSKFEGKEIETIMEFGTGDIAVTGFRNSESKLTGISFENQKAVKIGTRDASTNGSKLSDSNSNVLMVFNKVESIEVVERALKEAKIRLKNYL